VSRHGLSLPVSRRRAGVRRTASRAVSLLFVALITLSSADGILQVEAQRLQQQRTQTARFSPAQPNTITPTARNQAAPPSGYSGAYPPYPLNHTLDAYPQILQDGPTNWDFETAATVVGTPPTDYAFETARSDLDQPTNYDFATGDFTGWTTNGSVTIGASGGPDGYFAQIPNTAGAFITTAAFTVSTAADAFVFDAGHANTIVDIYVLSGASYGTATKLDSLFCNASCSWMEASYAATTWRGQSIKLKFQRNVGVSYIDRVRTVELAAGWDMSGTPQLVSYAGDQWLQGTTDLTSPAFTVDSSAQYATAQVKKSSGVSTAQREVFILSGSGYATSTKVGSFSTNGELSVHIPLYPWAGQSVKLRIGGTSINGIAVNDVGIQRLEAAGWTLHTPTYNRILNTQIGSGLTELTGPLGADDYDPGAVLALSQYDQIDSAALSVPSGAQQLLLMHRTDYDGAGVPSLTVKVLSGSGYATVTNLTPIAIASPSTDWSWLTLPISSFAGQSIKLRLAANARILLNDVGFIGQVAPGWSVSGSDAVTVRFDAVAGTYLQAQDPTKGFIVSSSPVSGGIVDATTGSTDGRSIALGYQFGANASSSLKVEWVPLVGGVAQTPVQVYFASAGSTTNTAFKDARFSVREFQLPTDGSGKRIQTGYYTITGTNGARLYQIADNIARQQQAEPFSMRVGVGVDAITGSFSWHETDLTFGGGPFPLVLNRYYSGHADRLGPLGYRWRHSFDTQLYIGTGQTTIAVLFGDGREEAFEWDGTSAYLPVDGRVQSTLVKTVVGGVTSYTYTTTTNLTYDFNDKGQLIHVVDLNGNSLDFVYDGSDRLSTVTTVGGRTLTFAYTGSQLTSVTGPDSSSVSYTYDSHGDLVSVDKPDDQHSEYTYSRHRLRHLFQTVEPGPGQAAELMEVAANKLDDYNRVTRQTDPSGVDLQITYQYDLPTSTDAAGVTSVKDRSASGAITRYDFDHFGHISFVTSPEGVVTQFIFDAKGQLEKWIDGNNGEYSFTYTSSGDLATITDPLNTVRNITVNAQHLPTEVDDGAGHLTTNTYDSNGNLTRTVVDAGIDPANLNLTTGYEYDSAGNRTAIVVDPDDGVGDPELNLRTAWTYTSAGLPATKTIDPDDGAGIPELDLTWEYAYNSQGQLLVEIDPSGLRKRYTYTIFGRIETTIIDPATKADTSSWGDDPTPDYLNLVSRYVFDIGGKLVATMDPICTAEYPLPQDCQSEWYYNDLGLVSDKYDATDVRTHYDYDDTGQMTAVVQDATMPTPLGTELNRTTHYAYDDDGRLARVIVDPDDGTGDPELNLVTEYHYDPAGRLETETVDPDNLALTTTYSYDAKGRLIAKQTPGMTGSEGWSYTYDDADRLITTTDPMGRVTKNEYDGAGRLVKTIIDPDDPGHAGAELNLTTTYVYDDASRLIQTIAPDGVITQTAYDAASRVIATTLDPDDGVGDPELNLETISTYYPNGALWTTTDPEGHVTERLYDRAGRLDTVIAPGNRQTHYAYDRNSRLIRQTSPGGIVTASEYDLMGRRTTTTVNPYADPENPAGELNLTTTVTYDRLGRQRAVEDPRGNTSQTAYDAAGRVIRLTDDLHPVAGLDLAYDAAGRLTDVTDPLGAVTHTTFSDAGNPLTSTVGFGTASAQTRTREYDLSGTLTRQLDPNGNDLRYTYDRAGRLNEIWTPGTPNVTYASYSYDAAGRTTGVINYTGTVGYQYDAAGRVEQVSSPQGTVSYTSNAIGQRTSMTLPGSRTVSYAYDATTADLATITDWSTAPAPMAFTFTADGQLETVTRPTGTGTAAEDIVSTYQYDAAGRLEAISHAQNGVALAEYGYTLDANGNRTQIDITGSAVANGYEAYTYDALDRVDYARYVDGGTATFHYDANGNRDTVSAGGVTTTYAYDDLGQLVGITDDDALSPLDLAIAYDANGNRRTVTNNTTSAVTRDYTWDWANRLTEAEVNGTTTDYAYLGDDTRESQATSSGTTDYLYDRVGGLPQVVDDGTNGYLHDVTGNLVSIDGSDTPTYPLQDALGSVRLSLDDTGSVLGTREWDAWGTARSSTGSGYGFGWTGEQYDSTSDLTYLRARYYSPGTASFLSRDTVQPNAGGTTGYNPYAYANSNPTMYTDPTGHFGVPGFPVVGVFLLLALLFECYISGLCRYAAEHADEWANSAVKAAKSAAKWATMAIGWGLSVILQLFPTTPRVFLPDPSPGDVGKCTNGPKTDGVCPGEDETDETFWHYVNSVSFGLSLAQFSAMKCAIGEGQSVDSVKYPVSWMTMCKFGAANPYETKGDWTDDRCSIPVFKDAFDLEDESHVRACVRHDFSYRNFNRVNFPNRVMGEPLRIRVDSALRDNLQESCKLSGLEEDFRCNLEAANIASYVASFSWWAWDGY
jgi:RHS repeat-associated protein